MVQLTSNEAQTAIKRLMDCTKVVERAKQMNQSSMDMLSAATQVVPASRSRRRRRSAPG
jgi:hypothetical protein